MQKLRSLLPGQHASGQQRHSVSLEPEIGFQITIESSQQSTTTQTTTTATSSSSTNVSNSDVVTFTGSQKTTVPELNVHLLAARHLPALFGFKVVQGYLIKVKLFPGSKRLDSSIQTNSWPKFNENFKFPLAPDIKPSLKTYSRRGSRTVAEYTPEELFAGQFVVFTVYALLELPPASFNRFNKTYRSLRDKSTNLVQKVVESSSGIKAKSEDKENNGQAGANGSSEGQRVKRKPSNAANPRDAIPPLTISESRRNIGSVTCYLEPKIFQRNPKTGVYSTEELWLPIKDITSTVPKGPPNNLTNAPKGVVEIVLELRDLSEDAVHTNGLHAEGANSQNSKPTANATPTNVSTTTSTPAPGQKHAQWTRMTSEVRRKMGLSNAAKVGQRRNLVLRVTTARMRCSNKVKDELEASAGSVYVKTSVFEHNIYVDAWKSANFYPSLSTKWGDAADAATLTIPLQSLDDLQHLLVRTTLATKTKMAKKLVLGTVEVGVAAVTGAAMGSSGAEQIERLREAGVGERVAVWHCFQ